MSTVLSPMVLLIFSIDPKYAHRTSSPLLRFDKFSEDVDSCDCFRSRICACGCNVLLQRENSHLGLCFACVSMVLIKSHIALRSTALAAQSARSFSTPRMQRIAWILMASRIWRTMSAWKDFRPCCWTTICVDQERHQAGSNGQYSSLDSIHSLMHAALCRMHQQGLCCAECHFAGAELGRHLHGAAQRGRS